MKLNLLETAIAMLPLLAAASTIEARTNSFVMRIDCKTASTQQEQPVVIKLSGQDYTHSAKVEIDGKPVPCQLDDFDHDGIYDELCFLTNASQDGQKAIITLSDTEETAPSKPRTYAEIVLRNPKVKEKNRHDIYLDDITIDARTANPYNVLHHHGVAFENELIALRIYMDRRQTLDLYGKFNKGLELEQTQFYTNKEQKQQGYGDDILWVGDSYGLGAMRGWNGKEPTMIEPVNRRSQRILTMGPVRTIVEMEDWGWIPACETSPVNMRLRYTLYAGHRDVRVDVDFSRNTGCDFATGIVNVKGSTEYSDHNGLRGCWGTDWPSADTVNFKRETVGLGICIPEKYMVRETAPDKLNYTLVVKPQSRHLTYYIAYASDNESFGMHSGNAWFKWLKTWKQELETSDAYSQKYTDIRFLKHI